MKVKQSSAPAGKAILSAGSLRTSLVRILGLLGMALFFFFVIVVFSKPAAVQKLARDMEVRWGYEFRSLDAGLTEKASIAIGAYLQEVKEGVPDIPELYIDVPFKEAQRIYAKREEAIARGILVQGPDDFVKAEIRYEDRVVPVKMRLKGDWTDHLVGLKWSFRIHTRNGEQLFGLRRFSIQNPSTRGFQAEVLFFDLLQRYGVMYPRYMFVNVKFNGESVGIMAIEEFFTKELLEFNRRREGVIVRLDESLVWESKDSYSGEPVGWGGAFDHYSNATIDAFGSTRIAESESLTAQYQVAEGLLRAFIDGSLKASEVFDVKQMGAYIAVADFFGSWHTVAWHNLRFYLNPISMQLEPIAFDATLQERFMGVDSVVNDEPMVARMLEDPAIWEEYARVLRELAADFSSGELKERLRSTESEPLRLLQTEFRLLGEYPLDDTQVRLDALLEAAAVHEAATDKSMRLYNFAEQEVLQYPAFAHFGLTGTESTPVLRIDTAIPKDVRVMNAEWVQPASGSRENALPADVSLPVYLPARGIGSVGQRLLLDLLPAPAVPGWELEVTAGLRGRQWVKQFRATRLYPALQAPPIPVSSLQEQLAAHEYLELVEEGVLRIEGGTWQINQSLIIPHDHTLQISAGTNLEFGPDALLISHGPVRIIGKAYAPVTLGAANGVNWPGIAVMDAADQSVMDHVIVKDTRGVSVGGWSLTGGVNFYSSDVVISNCQFLDSHGEDALNIIQAEFELRNTTINGTASDAFDADFASGLVAGGQFLNIGKAGGGDAIDVSGSQISVTGTKFAGISDKALSVGERSEMHARDVDIAAVGTGAASKDGSRLFISDSSIRDAGFAGMTAYIKKPEYGPAEVIAENVRIEATETPILVQTRSRVALDGDDQPSRDVDVDALYDTVMRPGLRK